MKIRNAVLTSLIALATAPAFAAVITLDSISGAWNNAVPAGVVINNGGNPVTARWGTPFGQPNQSGYDFTPVAGVVNFGDVPPDSGPTIVGLFNHLNFPILLSGVVLESIGLAINANVNVDGVFQENVNFAFDLTHEETPNGNPAAGGACPYGGANGQGVNVNGCADRVTISSNNLTESFTVDGVQYTLDILGFFSIAEQIFVTDFLTTENGENPAFLVAQVRAVEVPEPGSLALVGLGLLAAGFVRRRSLR